jgi:hypothetical protein
VVGGTDGGVAGDAASPLPKISTMVPGASNPLGLGFSRCNTEPWLTMGTALGVTPPLIVSEAGANADALAASVTATGLAALEGAHVAE